MSIASFQSVYGITMIPFSGGTSLPVFAGVSAAATNGIGFVTNPYVVAQIIMPSNIGGTLLVSGFTGIFGGPLIANLTVEGPAKIYVAGGGATATGFIMQKLGPGYAGAGVSLL